MEKPSQLLQFFFGPFKIQEVGSTDSSFWWHAVKAAGGIAYNPAGFQILVLESAHNHLVILKIISKELESKTRVAFME